MAAERQEDEEQRMSLDPGEARDASSSSSENEESDVDEEAPQVEWLATGREKRSTAGNRMKSMLAAEEPDDELELLFAEDGSDEGFTDVDEDGSDVHMDSSSDDEDAQENGDMDEGEKELERQARENRQAARKRKAQEAIPMKFRKKARTNPVAVERSTAAPLPRPKKKSERTSWLPSPLDAPTRASKRETTMMSKEQLHQQMIEREVKRLKQVAAMERKAKKMEALKKPPMTQAERLAEAALVEKRNAKSLNRWEEAEKLREEERRAKLAALNNRKLNGPVVTFWSGVGEWVDGRLKHVGKIITIEEKPLKKKRASAVGTEEPSEETPSKEQSVKEAQARVTTTPPPSTSDPAKVDKQLKSPKTTEPTVSISKSAKIGELPPTPDTTEPTASTPDLVKVDKPPQPPKTTEPTASISDPAKIGEQPSLPNTTEPTVSTFDSAKSQQVLPETIESTASQSKPAEVDKSPQPPETTEKPTSVGTESGTKPNLTTSSSAQEDQLSAAPLASQPEIQPQGLKESDLSTIEPRAPEPNPLGTQPPDTRSPETKQLETKLPETKPLETKLSEPKPPVMKPPEMRPPNAGPYTTSMFAPAPGAQLMKPPEMKAPTNSFLAPPQGITHSGLSMPVLGYSPSTNKTSNVLAPPNTTQSHSPLSMPQTKPPPSIPMAPPRPSQTPPAAAPIKQTPVKAASKTTSKTASRPLGSLKSSHANTSKKQANVRAPSPPPSPPPPPPPDGKATRNCIILQNFDENAIKEKAVQQHILFGKEMSKLAKPAPAPRCIITNRPARYKDPKTGLPYYNLQAFKEIRRLQRGDYKWSRLVGAWVGSGSFAAQGVPARFLDPNAPAPPAKKTETKAAEPASGVKQGEAAATKTAGPTAETKGSMPSSQVASVVTNVPRAAGTPSTTAPAPTHTTPTGTSPPINT